MVFRDTCGQELAFCEGNYRALLNDTAWNEKISVMKSRFGVNLKKAGKFLTPVKEIVHTLGNRTIPTFLLLV